ncbi:hypothetical protein M972_112607 [Acetivibrio thermocellus AD2]|jgi:hypothetical protein|uniref:Uncharacterized protein n=1 Tax=Acetivibrio thermocellus AD2 TaxID=1138384 RepID=A0AB36TIY7_ACETH|nr:hypothetical protein [Acetivibrio thermocellus]ADU75513.1 hypothetical protein Clo1313_2503 [Acetivibrio thermocellus DSM 1313]ALX09516.1 hypothetical protein AD2_02530 [Acetivibrio thermocellus AD2]ANV77270.1 hypothetical protein LQRI_2529 [Acetivibrio thermocellus DSM 2360]EIC04640.1 hypothetical protein YSBL_1816 [Acetivibrio thermocellus YS]PFH03793.1 hypothetical protein M972_112607 [Acetivibrio thermocellus AD2]
MVKVKLILIAMVICAVSLLSACGGSDEINSQPSHKPKENSAQDTFKNEDKKEKTNAEKFLEYAIKAADLRNFTETGDYAGIINTLNDLYKKDIVNPYTGGTSLTIMNRTSSMMKKQHLSRTRLFSVDCVVIDDYMTQLKDLDTSEVVYCVNPESKGMVFAFWLMDGVYIYEVNENGQKINEIKHFFEKEE